MSDGRNSILRRSAKLFNKAVSALYAFPKEEHGFHPEDRKRITDYNNHRPYGPAPRLCYAPYSNIFFNTEGRAIVCCKNTKVVLGRYPDNNLHSMWFGGKVAALRDYIQHHDLSHGCYKCREALHSGNYGSMTAAGFDFLRAWPASDYPRMMEFELSNVCNLECVMCSGRVSSGIRKHREGMSALEMKYDQGFVDQLHEFIPHLKQARFYGGEPFLIDIYYDIWSAIIKKNPAVDLYVLTNGTVLNDRVKRLLDKGNFTINVSMDSFQKKLYEEIRKNANYEETFANLHFFSELMKKRKRRLTLFITPMRMNWKEIPHMVEQCSLWDIDVYFSPAYFPETVSLWNLAPERLDEIIAHYRSANVGEGVNSARLKELTAELEYWANGQRTDPGFLDQFRSSSSLQEQIHEKDTPEIFIKDLDLYKDTFIRNICESNILEEEMERALFLRIEQVLADSGLEAVLVYFFLSQTKPIDIIDKMKALSNLEITTLLKNKQEELLKKHRLIK